MLTAFSISVRLKGRTVLDGVDFQVARGEMVGILGRNGAGKSTLVKVLAGLLPASGVRLEDQPLDRLAPRARARAVAYMPQAGGAAWPIACRDVVALGRLPHRRSPAADRRAIDAAMAAADVSHLAARPLTTLSGGERARVLLARALAVEAPVLLADEPVAHLDPCHQLRVLDLLRTRADQGDAVVVVLHDLALAERYCDRVVVLDGGRVAAAGLPHAVLDDGLLARVFAVTVQRGQGDDGRSFLLPWLRVAS